MASDPRSDLELDDMADLESGLHDLPQELYDEIKELTFAVEANGTIEIDSEYKPPIQLQISSATRLAFATEYYKANTFHASTENIFHKWLCSLSPDHRELLQNMQVENPCQGGQHVCWNTWGAIEAHRFDLFNAEGRQVPEGLSVKRIHMNFYHDSGSGEQVWLSLGQH